MKKALAVFLSVVLILALIPTTIADTYSTSGFFKYTVENDEATIVGFVTGIPADIEIPSTIEEYPVVAIGDHAF